jgi:uncharacterized protein (TIGR02271 family)
MWQANTCVASTINVKEGQVMLRYSEHLYEGMDVFDANDEKIGTVDEILETAAGGTSASGGGYLRVPTGFLGLGREHHIPFNAIRSVEGERIYVNFAKDRLDELGYGEGPTDMDRRGSTRVTDSPEGTHRLQLREEELIARKRSVETGRVQVGKEVVSEERTLEVPVTREEVTIERRTVDRRPSDKPIEETSQSIEVPVHEERVDVEKQAVVYEEVGVRKDQVTQTERVSGQVRREEARIEGADKVNVRDASVTSESWEQAMPRYRKGWQTRYGNTASRWEDVEPVYRYGHELRGRPEYRGRGWDELEPDFRRDWEKRYPNTSWDRAREGIRDAWEDVTR